MKHSGYTLVEILVVVVILGIAASIVVPNLIEPGSLAVQAASRQVISDILIAQNEAVGQAARRRVHFDVANNSYRMTDGQDSTIALPWMKGGYVVSFKTDSRFHGVRLESVNFGDGKTWVGFDEIGGPEFGGTLLLVANDHRYLIRVREFTGRVTVEPAPPPDPEP